MRSLAVLLLLFAFAARHAWSQAPDLPAAPSSAAEPAPRSAIFALPKPTQTVTSSADATPPSTPDTPENCYAPATGIYAPHSLPPQLKVAVDRYSSLANQRIGTMWFHNMPRAANDPWLKRAVVVIRFAILPDGSIDAPLITASSGRSGYDHHALEAIRQASPFDPLPEGVKRPLPVCFSFRYHADENDYQAKPKDLLPYPTRPSPQGAPLARDHPTGPGLVKADPSTRNLNARYNQLWARAHPRTPTAVHPEPNLS